MTIVLQIARRIASGPMQYASKFVQLWLFLAHLAEISDPVGATFNLLFCIFMYHS